MSTDRDSDFGSTTSSRRTARSRSALVLVALGAMFGMVLITGGAVAALLAWKSERNRSVARDVAEPPPVRLPVVSAEECERLGLRVEEAAMNGDVAALEVLYDWDLVIDRASSGLDIRDADRQAFAAGVKQASANGALRRIADASAAGGRFDYLRIVQRDGRSRALCRLITPEGGFDFFEYLPAGRGDSLRIADAFVYSTGGDMSTVLRRGLLPVAAHGNRNLLERLAGVENELVQHADDVGRMSEATQKADWDGALAVYDTLPEALRHDKNLLLLALNAAGLDGKNERYVELIEAFRAHHPDDLAVEMMLIDYHYLRNEFDEAFAALQRLDRRLDGDAFVKTVMANVRIEQKRFSDADSLLNTAIDVEPDLVEPYLAAIGVATAQGDHAAAAERLETLAGRAELDLPGLRTALAVYPGAEAFFASDAYREWEDAYRSWDDAMR